MSLLIVGSLGKATGLKGEVFVQAYNPDSPHWEAGTSLHIFPIGTASPTESGILEAKPQQTVRIVTVRIGAKGRLVLRLAEVRSRTAAEALRNCPVAISLESLETPADDEFYYHEVIGWEVYEADGTKVGVVVRAVETYMDLVEIRPSAGGETFYVPVVGDLITKIDRENRVLHVALPEGLVP